MPSEKCIDLSSTTATNTLKLDNELAAALVETKLGGVLSAPFSPDITNASNERSVVSDDEEEQLHVALESVDAVKDECSAASTRSSGEATTCSPEIAKTPSNSEEMLEDWNLVVVPVSEGEASILPLIAAEDTTAASPAEQIPRCDLEEEPLPSPDEGGVQVSISDMQEVRRLEQQNAVEESSKEAMDPMKMLRKGAVAAVGGTIMGVGLIMIPLPTPFGAVVASSGLALLGTEFDGAREMNDKMINTVKTHWVATREKMIQGLEGIEGSRSAEDEDEDEKIQEASDKPIPAGIMNAAEEKRQGDLIKQYCKPKQPDFFDQLKQSTGAYLTRHLLPVLKRSKEASEMGSVPDADQTVQSETETISEMDQTEYLGEDPKYAESTAAPVESTDSNRAILSNAVSSLSDEGTNATEKLAADASL